MRYKKTSIIDLGEFTNTQPVAVRRKADTTQITYDGIKMSKNCEGLSVTKIIRTYADNMVVLGFAFKMIGSGTYIFVG